MTTTTSALLDITARLADLLDPEDRICLGDFCHQRAGTAPDMAQITHDHITIGFDLDEITRVLTWVESW